VIVSAPEPEAAIATPAAGDPPPGG
jgi:hypothetical protein